MDWPTVGPTIYRHLDALAIPVLYAPFDVPGEQATLEFLAAQGPPGAHTNGKLEPGWMVVAEIVRRIDQTQPKSTEAHA